MSYLVSTPSIKKKFCHHEFVTRYPHGPDKPIELCLKCNKQKERKIKSKKLTKFLPAFEQSKIEDKYRFMTDWKTAQYDGWKIPGTEEAHEWCDVWQTKGCLNVEGHKHSAFENKIYVKVYKRGCFRPSCEKCYFRWAARQSNRSTRRIEKYEKKSGYQPKHVILSVSDFDYRLSIKELRKKAVCVLKEIGVIGGAIIFHAFRLNKKLGCLYFAPHFHIVGFGRISKIADCYKKYHWVIIDKGFRKSVFGTFHYNLSHCGIKKGFKALTWFGEVSYSKMESDPEPDSSLCPLCGRKLVPIYHDGVHPVVPPDQNYEGFVDPFDWYEVKTIPKSEWTEIKRYEYALEKELYMANKGRIK